MASGETIQFVDFNWFASISIVMRHEVMDDKGMEHEETAWQFNGNTGELKWYTAPGALKPTAKRKNFGIMLI